MRALRATRASGEVVTITEQPLEVGANERVQLEVVWPECPTADACGDGVCGPDESRTSCAEPECMAPTGCGGQERYLFFDREQRVLTVRREALRVAWYGTGGQYEHERTGVSEQERASGSANVWTAPTQPGNYALWAVLRDSRGGVGVKQTAITVRSYDNP